MWTNIFLFLWIIGTVKYKATPIPIECARRVQRCPVEKDQWERKNDKLNCTGSYGYVCLKNTDGYLFETCMANFKVLANSRNCPTLVACQYNKPYLGKDTTFYYCPVDVSGCPPRNHADYSIHQLYKYPRCVESNFTEEMESTSTTATASISMATGFNGVNRQENIPVVIFFVGLTVALAVVGFFVGYIWWSRKGKCDYEYVSREEKGDKFKEEYYCKTLHGWIQIINKSEADRIRILPLKDDYTVEVDRIYVPLSIVVENEVCISGTAERQTISKLTPQKLLYNESGKLAHFIFMLGDAGYGKTVQCRRIAKTWCKAWKNENPQKTNIIEEDRLEKRYEGKEWEKCLKEYEFLFFVPMHGVRNELVSVNDIIEDYYRRLHTSQEHLSDIRTVLNAKKQKCLIILDGLDEWYISDSMKEKLLNKGIPNTNGMQNYTILMTMRYWRFMEVDPLCRQSSMNTMVRLHGLDDDDIKDLTKNVLCNYFHIERESHEFREQYQNVMNKTSSHVFELGSLMKIPLLAVFLILTWHEKIETGHSLTTFYLSMIEALIKSSVKRGLIEPKGGDDSVSCASSILKEYSDVTNFMSEISRLGKMALDGLTSQNTTLVLRDVQLEIPEVKETVALFVKIGLLSKYDLPGHIQEDNVGISFLHKTIQEFLSSFHLFHEKVDFGKFISDDVTDIGKALQFSTVLIFLSGLSPAVGCQISRHITDLSSKDEDICMFRDHFSTVTYNKVFHLFNLQLSCYREVRGWRSIENFRENDELKFSLSDIILLGNDTDRRTIRESAEVLLYHADDIKSLCMKYIPNDSYNGITNRELNDFLHKSESIEAINIDGYDRGECRLFHSFSPRTQCLRTLGLWNVAFANNILTYFLTKEDTYRRINALGLFYIKPSNDLDVEFQYQFASVRRSCSARSGYIQKVKMRSLSESYAKQKEKENIKPLLWDILKVLPEYRCLSTLHVSYIQSNADRRMLLNVLPQITTLKHFGYLGSSVYLKADEVYDAEVITVVLNINQLRLIYFTQITSKEKETCLNLQTMSLLEQITLEQFQMNRSGWGIFVSSLSDIKSLRKVILNDTNIDNESYEKLMSMKVRNGDSLNVVKDESTEW